MERIGKYEILGELGRGGMGVVYKARDPIIGRTVAVKVILEQLLHAADIKKRFYREARSAGQLSHDNITIIYDVDEDNGHPYLVMELLEGPTLRHLLLENTPLSFQDRIEIARQICQGLDYAHRHGVIHRDIKPENICVLPGGRVKIMDFGIARIQNETQTLTQTNMSVGTPRYMSPEQIKGERLDGRSDIFAFGVLFYELLTGLNPFAGEHVTTVIYKVLHEDPPPLSLQPGVLSASLEDIVRTCLAKEHTDRYDDCGAVATALATVLADQDRAVLQRIPAPLPIPETPLEAPPEKAAADETMTSLSAPAFEPPAKESKEPLEEAAGESRKEAARDETTARPVAPVREPLSPTPTGAAAGKKTVWNKYRLAVFGIILAAILAAGGYVILFILNPDTPETQTAPSPPLTEQPPPVNLDTPSASEPPLTRTTAPPETAPGGETDPSPAEEAGVDADQDETPPSSDETPPSDEAARRAAESARATMDQARRRIADRGTEADVADMFERAEATRRTGTNQLNAGNFEGAANAFRQTSGLFDQVKQALDEKDAALAAETDTDETPEIISITARTRKHAESARAVMQAAKDNVPSDRRRTPVYQEAMALEDQGTQFFGAKLYGRAFLRFGKAKAKYEEAAVAQTAGAVSPALQTAVNGFARTLKTSIEREDTNGMKAMLYQDRDWRAFFEKAEVVAAVVRTGAVQARGTRATVPVRVALTYHDEQNQTQQETLLHLWILQNMGGDWMLTRVRPMP